MGNTESFEVVRRYTTSKDEANLCLSFAAQLGDMNSAHAALNRSADPNWCRPSRPESALSSMASIFSRHNYTMEGANALHWACFNGNSDIASVLLENCVNVGVILSSRLKGAKDATPLHVACYMGHVGIVELLLNSGADLECRTASESTLLNRFSGKSGGILTPLLVACKQGHVAVAKQLLDTGADWTASSEGGVPAFGCMQMLLGNY